MAASPAWRHTRAWRLALSRRGLAATNHSCFIPCVRKLVKNTATGLKNSCTPLSPTPPEAPMLDNPKLTARQQQVLDLIQNPMARAAPPPPRAEIAAELGFKSANAAEEHLQALARKGAIELVSGTSRGIRLHSETLRSIHAARSGPSGAGNPGSSPWVLPLIGRVAAGSPILAQEHVEQTYSVENGLFQHKPDYLLKVRGMSMRDAG